jgi:DNA gyrase/topoisomerase IV subunit A
MGSRYYGGKDAVQPRYGWTHLERWVSYVFRQEDTPILEILEDEGYPIEPRVFYPILPMILVNGSRCGIGTGWSTRIPAHDPLDLIAWIRARMDGAEPPSVKPKYLGFRGVIQFEDRVPAKSKKQEAFNFSASASTPSTPAAASPVSPAVPASPVSPFGPESQGNQEEQAAQLGAQFLDEVDQEEYEEEEILEMSRFRLATYGVYQIKNERGKRKIIITELPIGRCPKSYRLWLEKLRVDKEIEDVRDQGAGDEIYFEITGWGRKKKEEDQKEVSYQNLRLVSSIPMTNMTLLNERGVPVRYETVYHILEEWYQFRYRKYEERKEYQVQSLREKIAKMSEKLKFVIAVNDGRLKVMRVPKAQILAQMQQLEIASWVYELVKVHQCSKEEEDRLRAKIETAQAEAERLAQTDVRTIWWGELEQFMKVYQQSDKYKENLRVEKEKHQGNRVRV